MISKEQPSPSTISELDRRLLAAMQDGLPLVPRPYAEIGSQIGISEEEVTERIRHLQQNGIIRRMGIIVHHRPLGYRANAMVVWNLPPNQVEAFGNEVAKLDFVTLCYQRQPDLEWPYNLYTMIHGRDRGSVMGRVRTLLSLAPTENIDHQVLFSNRRFKQHGARYFSPQTENRDPLENAYKDEVKHPQ